MNWQTDDVEVIAFDSTNQTATDALDPITTSFITKTEYEQDNTSST